MTAYIPREKPLSALYVPTMRAVDTLTLAARQALDHMRPLVHAHCETHRRRTVDECRFCADRVMRRARIAEIRQWMEREVQVLLEETQKAQQKDLQKALKVDKGEVPQEAVEAARGVRRHD